MTDDRPPGPPDPPRPNPQDPPGKVLILRELYPTCFWHYGCEHHPAPPMIRISHEPEYSVFECGRCGKRGRYPVGGSGLEACEPEEQTNDR